MFTVVIHPRSISQSRPDLLKYKNCLPCLHHFLPVLILKSGFHSLLDVLTNIFTSPFFTKKQSKVGLPGKGNTIFEIRTAKLATLPLVDFQPRDYGLPNQAFGFQAGPVCFK